MESTITALIEKFGSQEKAAEALGVKGRTFRNYVRNPDSVPEPARKGMLYLLGSPTASASPIPPDTPSEARP